MTQTSRTTKRTGIFQLNTQNERPLTGVVKMDIRSKDIHLDPGPENLIHISAVRFIAVKINLSNHKKNVKLHVMPLEKPGQPWHATLEARNNMDALTYAEKSLKEFFSIQMND